MTPRDAEDGVASWILQGAGTSQGALTGLAASALLLVYPILLLTVREGVNVCGALLVLLAFLWLSSAGRASLRNLNRGEIAFAAAMSSLVLATALSQLWHWHFRSPPYDDAGRFLLAVPIYLLLRSCRPEILASVQYGVPLGAIAGALVVLPQLPLAAGARAGIDYMDAIRFGDLALVLGIFSIASVNRTDARWIIALKVAGAAAGLFASIESGTRGGWIALPPAVFVWWLLRGRGTLSWRSGAALAGLLTVLAATSYLFVGQVHDRMVAFYTDVVGLSHADLDTSLGLRLQIWRAAMRLFAENPIFGIGPDEFRNVVPRMKDLGLLTSEGAENGYAEVHSEILLHTVSLGVFGLASIVSIYATPLILFIQAATAKADVPARVRSAGAIGACFVVSFLVFGLTIEIFNLKLIATFYSVTVAVLLAATRHAGTPVKARPPD